MAEFALDLVIDPSTAQAGTQKVVEGLQVAEQEAKDLKAALVAALSARDAGTTAALRGIEQVLGRTEERAIVTDARISQLGKDLTGRNVDQFGNALEGAQKKAAGLERTLKRLFAGFTIAFVLRELQQMADLATNVTNRVRLVTSSQAELVAVQEELFDIAVRTRSAFEGTAQVFSRLAVSAKELGTDNAELLRFTESLNKAIILSGASGEEARNGLIQLSQGLASGALRGDELRSVLEQLPAVADVIAKRMGVTRGELRLLGQQGLITSKIILEAFRDAAEEIDERFATTTPTIGQAFSVLRTELVQTIAGVNEATGASEAFAGAVIVLAENLDVVADAAAGLAVAYGLKLAAKAIPAAIKAVKELTAAQIAQGAAFGAAAIGVGLLVDKLAQLEENARGIEAAKDIAIDQSATLTQFALLNNQIKTTQRELERLQAIFDAGGRTNDVAAARIRQLEAALAALTSQSRQQVDASRDSAAARDREKESTQELLKELREEARLLQLTDDERKIQERLLQAEKALEKDKTDLKLDTNAALRAEFESLIRGNAARARENELVAKFGTSSEGYKDTLRELEALHERGRLSLDALNKARSELTAKAGKVQKAEDPFVDAIKSLERQNEELRIRAEHTGLEREGLLLELEIFGKIGVATREQQAALAHQVALRQEHNAEIDRQRQLEEDAADAARDAEREAEARKQRTEELKRQVDVVGALKAEEQELLDLQREAPKLQGQIALALEENRMRQLEASENFGAGVERAFLRIKQEARDLAAVGDQIVTAFADRATDALITFAQTGELSFKQLATAILDDLTRILARLLVVQAISLALGGSAPAGATNLALNQGRQHGGTVQPGQRPVPVGEGGPELFVPNRTGTIVPNPRDVPQAPAPVNVQVVNVASDDDVPRALNGGGSDDAIVNVIARNRDRIRSMIA